MTDIDIPVAFATIDDQFVPMAPPAAINTGTQVHMSKEKSKVLHEPELLALKEQGFTRGLAEAMTKNNSAFPLRIWVVDNSGSMSKNDGHRTVATTKKDDVKIVSCTRWAEIQETVDYHAQMAALLQAPTVFRLLNDPGSSNGPQQFSIAERGEKFLDEDLQIAYNTMHKASPGGVTPLAAHVREIRDNIQLLLPTLSRDGTKVAVVLATDGLPTDHRGVGDAHSQQDFVDALRSLEGLPVWVVVRLCTDEQNVVDFYNDLDANLEYSLEVLNDFQEEAKEIYPYNPWLNYALPMHRCREMGYHNRLFDLMDERQLTKDELVDILILLFGEGQLDGIPNVHADWKGFLQAVSRLMKNEENQWNPITRKVSPWIDLKKLKKVYGKATCNIM